MWRYAMLNQRTCAGAEPASDGDGFHHFPGKLIVSTTSEAIRPRLFGTGAPYRVPILLTYHTTCLEHTVKIDQDNGPGANPSAPDASGEDKQPEAPATDPREESQLKKARQDAAGYRRRLRDYEAAEADRAAAASTAETERLKEQQQWKALAESNEQKLNDLTAKQSAYRTRVEANAIRARVQIEMAAAGFSEDQTSSLLHSVLAAVNATVDDELNITGEFGEVIAKLTRDFGINVDDKLADPSASRPTRQQLFSSQRPAPNASDPQSSSARFRKGIASAIS